MTESQIVANDRVEWEAARNQQDCGGASSLLHLVQARPPQDCETTDD